MTPSDQIERRAEATAVSGPLPSVDESPAPGAGPASVTGAAAAVSGLPASVGGVSIRAARPAEHAAVGALTFEAYAGAGLLDDDSGYAHELRDARGRAEHADVLVAVDEAGTLLGTVTFCLPGSPHAELSGDGQAEFRMLAVSAAARGRGVGGMLVRACLDRASALGCHSVVISTRPQMRAAHRLYEQLGFVRTPQLDWHPHPQIELLAYIRTL